MHGLRYLAVETYLGEDPLDADTLERFVLEVSSHLVTLIRLTVNVVGGTRTEARRISLRALEVGLEIRGLDIEVVVHENRDVKAEE